MTLTSVLAIPADPRLDREECRLHGGAGAEDTKQEATEVLVRDAVRANGVDALAVEVASVVGEGSEDVVKILQRPGLSRARITRR